MEYDKKKLSFLLIFLLFSLASVSAITLSSGTVLNTTSSKTSATFSITITAQNITINPNSIYLYFIIYTQNNDTKFCVFKNLTTPNSNTDSSAFGCTGTAPSTAGGGGTGQEVLPLAPCTLQNITTGYAPTCGNLQVCVNSQCINSFCGDGFCAPLNYYGLKEDFYSCQMDCKPFDLDALVFSFTKNCWDKDPSTTCVFGIGNVKIEQKDKTIFRDGEVCLNEVCERLSGKTMITNCFGNKNLPCFWDTDTAIISLFIIGVILIVVSFVRIKSKDVPGKRISPYTFIFLAIKKRRKRKKKKWKKLTFRTG